MIFLGFKPLDIKQQEFIDVPLFQLNSFTLHEFDDKSLVTLMEGTKGTRYADRYKVSNIDYTDNSKKYIANMRADNGLYRDIDDNVDLKGNVFYNREDGLIFETQEATYSKKTSIAKTKTPYVMYRGSNRATGSELEYNNETNKIKSKNIKIKYKLKEKKWINT